jgi:hypothetical protein
MSYHIYSKHLNLAMPFPFYTLEAAQAHFDKRDLSPERYGITERVERVTEDSEDYTETNQTYGEFALETSEVFRRRMGDGL